MVPDLRRQVTRTKGYGVLPLVVGTCGHGDRPSRRGPARPRPAVLPLGVRDPAFGKWLKPILEVLAGVPTVVYGFFALILVHAGPAGPGLRRSVFNIAVAGHGDGRHDHPDGRVALRGRDVRGAAGLRQGSFALGANRMQTPPGGRSRCPLRASSPRSCSASPGGRRDHDPGRWPAAAPTLTLEPARASQTMTGFIAQTARR